MAAPYGPKPISKKGQLTLPLELLKSVQLAPGDQVYVLASEDPPGGILVIPFDTAVRWFDHGRRTANRKSRARRRT